MIGFFLVWMLWGMPLTLVLLDLLNRKINGKSILHDLSDVDETIVMAMMWLVASAMWPITALVFGAAYTLAELQDRNRKTHEG